MKKIKILYITARADIGGGPKHLFDLITGIQKNYPEIEISIAAPNQEPFASIYKTQTQNFLEIPARSFSLVAFVKILYFCVTNNIEIIHSHGRGAGFYSRLLGLFSFRIIHTLHGLHLEESLSGRLKLLIDKLLSPLTDLQINVSQDEQNRADKVGMKPQSSLVIRNGIDIKNINLKFNELDPVLAREHFKLPKGKIILGALARHDFAKGIDLLIDLANRGVPENYLFAIAGDGELLEKHRGMIKNNSVILLGKTLEPLTFLKAIDVFVSFSRWEGLPLAVLEALSCGRPCLLSDVTGNRELKNYASFFKHGDIDSFWKALAETKTPHFDQFLKEFNLDHMIQETVRTYS